MPIMHVYLVEGRSEEQRAGLIAALTEAAVRSVGAPIESVRVLITEVPAANFGKAGTTMKKLAGKEAAS